MRYHCTRRFAVVSCDCRRVRMSDRWFHPGDNKLAAEGALPSMISQLDMTAGGYMKTCSRYYMMTPDGEMLCKDEAGKIVATTVEEILSKGNAVSRPTPKPSLLANTFQLGWENGRVQHKLGTI